MFSQVAAAGLEQKHKAPETDRPLRSSEVRSAFVLPRRRPAASARYAPSLAGPVRSPQSRGAAVGRGWRRPTAETTPKLSRRLNQGPGGYSNDFPH